MQKVTYALCGDEQVSIVSQKWYNKYRSNCNVGSRVQPFKVPHT